MAQARGSITEQDQAFTETWENIAIQANGVVKLDRRGDEQMEMITGRRRFFITTEERLITQDRIRDPKDDPFKNGAFRPIIVPDSVTIESNPNALDDDQIKSIFASSDLAWGEWMSVLDSPETLRRMMDMAGGDDVDISLKRYKQLGAKLAQVKPPTRITQRDQDEYEKMGQAPGAPGMPPGTPTRDDRSRKLGGRSADYR